MAAVEELIEYDVPYHHLVTASGCGAWGGRGRRRLVVKSASVTHCGEGKFKLADVANGDGVGAAGSLEDGGKRAELAVLSGRGGLWDGW
jgi:hypothetical protein